MSGKLQPALLGGLLIGVLSALPFVSILNGCCCLWVILGGVLTSYLLQEQSRVPITGGTAAVAGLQAGMVGAVVAAILGAAVTALMGGADQFAQIPQGDIPPQVAEMMERFRNMPAAVWYVGPFLAYIVIFPIFSVIGALLGVAIFKKTPPPPPPGTVEILPPE
jgi:uncharacterized membrane protein